MRHINKKSTLATTISIATSSSDNKVMMASKRRTADDFNGLTSSHVTYGSSRMLLLGLALFVLLASVNGATDQKTVQPSPTSPLSSSASLPAASKDEIYIDDESIEGSGGRGGLHDDLDKDPDYSGSGFGPDDEDSSTDLQHSHRGTHTQSGKHNTILTTDDNDDLITSRTHHQTNSGTIIGSNSGSNSGIIGGNSGSNTGLNTIGHTDDEDFDLGEGDGNDDDHDDEHKQRIGGSGDGGIDEDDDDDDHTGDIDEDGHDGLIERPHQRQHEFGVGNEPKTTAENSTSGSTTSSTTTSTSTTAGSVSSSSDGGKQKENKKKILGANGDDEDDRHDADDDEEDEFDETYDEDNNGDDEDDDEEDGRTHEEDDNTEVYIDGTESIAKGGNEDNERGTTNQGNTIHELDTNNVNSQPTDTKVIEHTTGNEVLIMNTSDDDRTASFFAQPGILAAVIGGAVVGLLCAILVVMFIVYRMRKKDEGSYALDEPKRSPAVNSYAKNANNREFYA